VLSRLFGISTPVNSAKGKKEFYELAQMMLDIRNPGEFNQALMEFGAIQCLPAQPLCRSCPLAMKCHAFANQATGSFPVKSKKAGSRDRYMNYLYLHQNGRLFL
jgi:A/G-specific adenine glycosylase